MRSDAIWRIASSEVSRNRSDRRGDRLEAEQARPDLVVKLECDVAPLIILGGDQPLAQPHILGPRAVERLRERIEPRRQGNKFTCFGDRQPHRVVPMLEIGEAARQAGEGG